MAMPCLLVLLAAACALAGAGAGAQSNYASHANNVEYQGEGLPEEATLDGRVTRLDDLSPVIALNRTRAALNCAAGSMHVELKFRQPFFGRAYADFDRNSACQLVGKGALAYALELPLKGCGTKQDPQRVFTNNIVVRFHPGLEMDGDEIITVVCRYPPPVAPPPAGLPSYIKEEPAPPAAVEPPLKGLHILLIICAILFLSLLLLGLGCSYVCLKRRNIRVVRRHPLTSAGTGSEITKLSGSSLGNLSMFEGLRIPRAHAPAAASVSGSEAQLISHSDTLPSDYPSESPSSAHSEVEDVDTRSLRRASSVSSGGSYDNKAFVPCPPPLPAPKFDVSVRVKKAAAPPPPPTPPPSDVESTMSVQARNLTTILEREELVRSSRPDPAAATTFSYVPEIHAAPSAAVRYAQTPPVYSRILRKQHEQVVREVTETLSDNDNWSQAEDTLEASHRMTTGLGLTPARSLTSLNTEMTDTRSMSEMVESSHQRYATTLAPPPPPPPPIAPATSRQVEFTDHATELIEPPLVAVERRPEVTQHIVDDVFLQTITEKRTIEDVERRRRQVTEFHSRPQPPSPKWDVVIRNYPDPNAPEPSGAPTTDWESYSEASSLSGVPTTPIAERHHAQLMQQQTVLDAPSASQPPPANWDVLIRVLNPPDDPEPVTETETSSMSVLTVEDRQKWRQIITTESTLRTLLTEATVREDYERIRRDQRYERLFEPDKWDVIIRVLAPPPRTGYDQRGGAGAGGARYRRKQQQQQLQQQQQDWETRSRRSSLPTLYEYDSDGGSSVRTLVAEGAAPGAGAGPAVDARSRRTSRSSLRSDLDVRSMTEMTVDFARSDRADTLSDASGPSTYGRRRFFDEDGEDGEEGAGRRAGSLARSASQPSLARSGSEFTEHWAAAEDERDGEPSSPEGSPRAGRIREQHRIQVQQQAQQLLQQAAAAAAASSSAPGGREIVLTATTTSVRETYERDWFGPASAQPDAGRR